MHGGESPQALAGARRRREERNLREAVATYGLPVEIEPHRALIEELWRTNGWVQHLHATLVNQRPPIDVGGPLGAQPSVTWRLYDQQRQHFARVARDCIQSGVEERMVRVLETNADAFVVFGQAMLRQAGVDPMSHEGRTCLDAGLAALPDTLITVEAPGSP